MNKDKQKSIDMFFKTKITLENDISKKIIFKSDAPSNDSPSKHHRIFYLLCYLLIYNCRLLFICIFNIMRLYLVNSLVCLFFGPG